MTEPTTNECQEVSPCVLPFFHIYGLTVLLISKLSLGIKTVTLPSFTPSTFVNSIREHKATLLHLVPPILLYLEGSKEVTPKDLESIRSIVCGAAPIGAMDIERFLKK